MIWILVALFIVGVSFGLVYPAAMILYYKLRYGRRVTVKWILREIGW